MKIKYTYSWPRPIPYEFPDNDRLDSLICAVQELEDGELEKTGGHNNQHVNLEH